MRLQRLASIKDLEKKDILKIFQLTDEIKKGRHKKSLQGNILALLFEKPSTRTRTSFESAMLRLGGSSIYLDARTTQSSRGETYADTARVLGLYVNVIAARMNRHEDFLELSGNAHVPAINALTDLEHPCQALSDIYTIRESNKKLEGVKLAFVGDIATNTSNSLLLLSTKLGMKFTMIGPAAIKPNASYLKAAMAYGHAEVSTSMKKGLSDADFVYTDTWVSMGEEAESSKKIRAFSGYQVDGKAMSYAAKGARFMHCLPAHRGQEVSAGVIDGKSSIVWEQAENKMYVEAAILLYLMKR